MNLEALANDITDVTDPSNMDKVLIYFEELQQEAEEYIELLHQKLQYRTITWEQPWYQGDTALTKQHAPFYQLNETAEEKFRTDKFTSEEHERIIKNWNRFIRKYNVPDKLRIFATWRNNNGSRLKANPQERVRRFVAAYLARGLQRTIQQVFGYIKFFNLSLDMTRRHKYSQSEKKIIEVCFTHKMDKAVPILALVLGRHIRGIRKRRAAVKSGKLGTKEKRKKWTIERAEKFLKGMLKYSELPLDELKDRTFEKSFWLHLQEEMDCDYTYLNFFWYAYLHVQLFVKCDIKLYKLRRKLFKLLRDSPYKLWSDIRWNEMLEHFPDGVTRRFLYKMCTSIVRKYPKYLKISLIELANYGLETIKANAYNKRLKRLMLNDKGSLEVIKYNPEN